MTRGHYELHERDASDVDPHALDEDERTVYRRLSSTGQWVVDGHKRQPIWPFLRERGLRLVGQQGIRELRVAYHWRGRLVVVGMTGDHATIEGAETTWVCRLTPGGDFEEIRGASK